MSSPSAHPGSRADKPGRILALDVFRGLTIAFMIIVNTPGNDAVSWEPLRHAAWHGFTPTDLVFPSFLFMIGVSAFYSLQKLPSPPTRDVWIKITRRTVLLFLIGMLMWYVPGLLVSLFTGQFTTQLSDTLQNLRIPGVLQRLALCYGIGSALALLLNRRALIAASALLLLGYWGALWIGRSGNEAYALQTNNVLRLDLWLMGPQHLYHGESVNGTPFAFDPEGLLSTLPALVTFILGYLTGAFLHRTPDRRSALSDLFPTAFLLITAGFLWDYWLGFPINKKLWTSSYTLFVGGLSLLLLSLTLWWVDVRGCRRGLTWLEVFGRSPLLAYLTSELGVTIFGGLVRWTDNHGQNTSALQWVYQHLCVPIAGNTGTSSFLFSTLYVAANWLIAWAIYRRGWIIKI